MAKELLTALQLVSDEKGISLEELVTTIEEAVAFAAGKRLSRRDLHARLDREKGEFELFERLVVVDDFTDQDADDFEPRADGAVEILIEEGVEKKENAAVGDIIEIPVTCRDLGRIAAQSVRRMIHKKGEEAERERLAKELASRIGEVVTGRYLKKLDEAYLFDCGEFEGTLPKRNKLSDDRYQRGRHVKLTIAEVVEGKRGPEVVLSRVAPELLSGLMAKETPELAEGLVTIMALVRDGEGRSKIVVRSTREEVDAVGACVGVKGSRIQPVMKELAGEKIDVIRWSDDPQVLVARALTPAKRMDVLPTHKAGEADVIVPDDQLSPAIGKKGVNVRLAEQLTGWSLNVMSQKEYDERKEHFARITAAGETPREKPDQREESKK